MGYTIETMKLKHFAMLLLTVALAVQLYTATFARMEADDYVEAAMAARLGSIGTALYFYAHWSGKFSHYVVASLGHSTFGSSAPAVIAVASVVTLVLATWYALRPHTRDALLLALAFTWGLLSTLPNWFQSFLWMSANTTYLLPLPLLIALVGWLSRQARPLSSPDSAKP